MKEEYQSLKRSSTRLLFLLTSCLLFALAAQGQTPVVKKVFLRCFPFGASTKLPVDSFFIQDTSPVKMRLKQPARFSQHIEAALRERDTVSMKFFNKEFVRFLFTISYSNIPDRKIYLAQGSTLLYGKKLYRLDNTLKDIIREFIENKDDYLPVKTTDKL